MQTLIRNIAQLVAVPAGPVRGPAMATPPIVTAAALVIEDGRIAWFGPEAELPAWSQTTPEKPFDLVIDANGSTVVPGLVDCHTHVVFAGSREGEFVQRIRGASYLEILKAGGGIRNTMRRVRAAAEEELAAESLPRLERMLAGGTTTVEIKSGYGLSAWDELKMLRAIRMLSEQLADRVEIVPTYLAAHTVPPEFDGRADDYIEAVTESSVLGAIAEDDLAEFADAFCEEGAFTPNQCRRFFRRCSTYCLTPKVHAEQITHTGSAQMGAAIGAASVDHLECAADEDIAALAVSQTIPVLLPGCSFFLGTPVAPARRMIDAGLPVALATDCNPGSSMIESLPLVMSMACTMLRMTPLEALVACTANAAAALRRAERIGAIAVGHQADLLVLDVPNVDMWTYRVGVNAVRTVIKSGRVVTMSDAGCGMSEAPP